MYVHCKNPACDKWSDVDIAGGAIYCPFCQRAYAEFGVNLCAIRDFYEAVIEVNRRRGNSSVVLLVVATVLSSPIMFLSTYWGGHDAFVLGIMLWMIILLGLCSLVQRFVDKLLPFPSDPQG